MGLGKKSNTLYLIDFGLAKKYRDNKTHQHIPYKENKSLAGTARYASINAHLGIEQSRRDDLEGLGYVLCFFLKGKLPWMGKRANNRAEKYAFIMEKKMVTPIESLVIGYPRIKICLISVGEFATYIHYCRALRYEDRPDYHYLKKLFLDVLKRENLDYDYVFDWTLTNADKANRQNAQNEIQVSEKKPKRVEEPVEPVEKPSEGKEIKVETDVIIINIKNRKKRQKRQREKMKLR